MDEKKVLECGHTQTVPAGRTAIWCSLCNDVAQVVVEPVAPPR